VTANVFWYSRTPFTVIGLPIGTEETEFAVQLPTGPYRTSPRLCVLVPQLTCTEDAVASERYGARVSCASAPGRSA